MFCYKYFAALPLDNDTAMKIELKTKKVQRTASFVERLHKDGSKGAEHRNLCNKMGIQIACKVQRTEIFVERCPKVGVKVRSTAILNQ
ncbi:MAG: hypothetical protein IH598_02775 [Bacteroidales bacterium]|nr:hypothetical protein [Bacteroidales bacterium]